MKKVKLLVGALLFTGMVFAQDVDAKVSASFKSKYPKGAAEEWYEEDSEVACDFENEGVFGRAYFDAKGPWLRSEFSLEESELPSAVRSAIKAIQPNTEITEATKVEMKDKTYFDVYTFDDNSSQYHFFRVDLSGKIEMNQKVEDSEE